MYPERTELSLDECALRRAGIDPDTCDRSVDQALELDLPGVKLAEKHLDELNQLVSKRLIPVSDGSDKATDEEAVIWHSHEIYISHQEFMYWLSVGSAASSTICSYNTLFYHSLQQNYYSSTRITYNEAPKTPKANVYRDKRSTLLAVAILARHTGLYEKYNEQGKKGGQKAIAQLIRDTAEDMDCSLQRLSIPTLQQLLKDAEDALKEQ